MSATTAEFGTAPAPNTVSDAEVHDLLESETDIEFFVVHKNKPRAGGAFFPYLNNTIYDLDKYCIFKTTNRFEYKRNCLHFALLAGGLNYIKVQQLILTIKNRTIHKCDSFEFCNELETNIELISSKHANVERRIEHYPMHPHIEYDENVKNGF